MTFDVASILAPVRQRLNDPEGRMWPDASLRIWIGEGLLDMSLRTDLFVLNGYVPIRSGRAEYDLSLLPDNPILKISRIEYDRHELPLVSHNDLDQWYGQWTDRTSPEPEYVLYSKQQPGQFRLYPIPEFQETNTVTPPTEDFGLITTLEGDTVTGPLVDNLSDFGMMADINSVEKYLHIYYIKNIATPANNQVVYNFHVQYRKPLIYYVTAEAFRDTVRSNQPDKASVEKAYYEQALESLIQEKAKSFKTPITARSYYRPFE